ncbi:hypothetical protein BpHYR1_008970 [Brachionus plicatilis]|uniref:Uncharacterized protein n=1 Tax=Brachionus plicatilis TaxID=10195 RepID=A0A3M7RX01_BRAPC|nr:hypothetical protein BpHYR1_008970 [Brachionus plicatilis]
MGSPTAVETFFLDIYQNEKFLSNHNKQHKIKFFFGLDLIYFAFHPDNPSNAKKRLGRLYLKKIKIILDCYMCNIVRKPDCRRMARS